MKNIAARNPKLALNKLTSFLEKYTNGDFSLKTHTSPKETITYATDILKEYFISIKEIKWVDYPTFIDQDGTAGICRSFYLREEDFPKYLNNTRFLVYECRLLKSVEETQTITRVILRGVFK